MIISILLALLSLLTGIFILGNISAGQPKLFSVELVVLVLFSLLVLVVIRSLQNQSRAKFLAELFFLCSTANAVLLYLATVRSLSVFFLAAVSLAGMFFSSFEVKVIKKKGKLRHKKGEVAKQLGPEEKKPKVVVLKKRAKRKKRK